ncbi:hypothetical protein [Streptomyces sp. TBY4]|uniref:hypothetical protein n=1 Tax=Streptomyces sp. TBY4 TaxID=2962030 RepID=UPI0020B6EF7E|nr:hypothetical protein [Streptomyces sp. TBY4]MCP3757907.1 hypothetical protein [Streptomyces sp. TBY4]
MAVLSTILMILGAWCAAGVLTAGLYAALRRLHVRRQRAAAVRPGGPVAAARGARPGRAGRLHRPLRLRRPHRFLGPAHPSGRSG